VIKYNLKSYCKINLTLKVLKKLKNGFHNIESLVTFCNLHDKITISKIKSTNDKIIFSGKFSRGINNKLNTINKVLFLLRKKNFFKNQAFKIKVIKNIPHGSGLGGGSSNAATLLNFFNSKMHLNLNKYEIIKMASQIGFDVPVNLLKQNTLIFGGSRNLLRFNQKFNLNLLIVYPNIVCTTKKIYKKNKKFSLVNNHLKTVNKKNKKQLINFLENENNDLQAAVFKYYPKVRKIINFIKLQKNCCFSRITGSGSACIGIFFDNRSAIYAQKLIKLKFPKYWCVVSKTI